MDHPSCSDVSFKTSIEEDLNFLLNNYNKRKCEQCKCENKLVHCELPCTIRPIINRSKSYDKSDKFNSCYEKDINEIDEYGRTILHTAVAECDAQLVEDLINRGADLSIKTKANLPILWFAVKSECVHTIEILVDHGCTISEQFLSYFLLEAINNQRYHMIEFLVHNGADVNESMTLKNERSVPLELTALKNNNKIMKFLLNHGASVDALDENDETALFKATRACSTGCVSLLLQHGANVNRKNKNSESVVHFPVQQRLYRPEILMSFLQAGADVNAETNLKETPLHFASRSICYYMCEDYEPIVTRRWQYEYYKINASTIHTPNAIEQLLRYKAKVNVKNSSGQTPLHLAMISGCPYAVQQLLDAGADVDAVDESGATPLKIAVKKGMTYVIRQLLIAGADPRPFFIKDGNNSLSPFVKRVFVEFFIARRAAGLSVGASLLSNVQIDDDSKLFEGKCVKEVEYMRTNAILENNGKSKITLLNFLRARKRRLATMSFKSKDFLKLITKKHYEKLPIYRDMLESNFVISSCYAPILDEATKNLNNICRYQLPEIVLNAIICKLDIENLTKVIDVALGSKRS